MPEEILSLTTIAERPTVNIVSKKHPAGKLYELANLADLGPFEYAIILQRDSEMRQLQAQKKKLTPAQERQTAKLLNDTVRLVCRDIEPAVMAALTPQQKHMICVAWSMHVQGAAEGNAPTPSRRTTAGSSQGSKRSTAATRKRGSTSRRGS